MVRAELMLLALGDTWDPAFGPRTPTLRLSRVGELHLLHASVLLCPLPPVAGFNII